ncbi:glycosyltransferase [Marinobacter alexandrii]|uniref:glycosyltransferase n=1 Tax=Marinobacter alexandrii TaxID=2570351 RepID=UPI001FFF04E1|nr:glycosyltransferase [Marinobacter alexandrii]MCK2150065.1 glycosyltransferase [Marinobacter alexandrii]
MTIKHSGRRDLAIINRSFWPVYPVIGEALLRLAEDLAGGKKVSVIMQDHADIHTSLRKGKRGANVEFFSGKAWSTSASGLFVRALDAVYFMLWVVFALLRSRPKTVYVSTDPPVLVPFVVAVYCALFRAKFIYHLQDIHPEAANVVIKVHPLLFTVLQRIDCFSMRRADVVITITEEMAEEIRKRSGTRSPINIEGNPAVSFDEVSQPPNKKKGLTFCGNAGRLQRIPLLIDSITQYLDAGGKLEFAFAGGGIYSSALAELAEKYDEVDFWGQITPAEAAQLNCNYEWALLPIEDEVTRYAFPSKSSSYVFARTAVLAVCGDDTSVAEWVSSQNLGVVCSPDVASLVGTFIRIESGELCSADFDGDREGLKAKLSFDHFVARLKSSIPVGEIG